MNQLANYEETEEFLYANYKGTLQIAGTLPRKFKDFSKDNFEQFSRLKWRSIEERIGNVKA
jgi:hypothetical protein